MLNSRGGRFGSRHFHIFPNILGETVRPWDEFKPYRLGGPLRNASEPPMSPLGLPPPYDAIGPAIQAVSAHIHCAVLCPLDEDFGSAGFGDDGLSGVGNVK